MKTLNGALPDDFPGKAALEAAEINTFAQLRKAQSAEDWPAQVEGVGDATATKIAERVAELEADLEPDASSDNDQATEDAQASSSATVASPLNLPAATAPSIEDLPKEPTWRPRRSIDQLPESAVAAPTPVSRQRIVKAQLALGNLMNNLDDPGTMKELADIFEAMVDHVREFLGLAPITRQSVELTRGAALAQSGDDTRVDSAGEPHIGGVRDPTPTARPS